MGASAAGTKRAPERNGTAPTRMGSPETSLPDDALPFTLPAFRDEALGIMNGEPVEPVRLRSDAPMPGTGKRITVFFLDDTEYTVPEEAPIHWAVQYLHAIGSGDDALAAKAQTFTLRRMLGDEGYREMVMYPQLTRDQYARIMAICFRSLLGRLEAPKAASGG